MSERDAGENTPTHVNEVDGYSEVAPQRARATNIDTNSGNCYSKKVQAL